MEKYKLFDAEFKFASIIWEFEPVNSTVLSKLCQEKLGWKKPTTYNILRKLCKRGFLRNENATVISLIKKEQVLEYESKALLEKAGSVPMFLASFLRSGKLTDSEVAEIRNLIEEGNENERYLC